jgi:hypothetical protein
MVEMMVASLAQSMVAIKVEMAAWMVAMKADHSVDQKAD